jgi:uncharacterized membrane protein
MTAVTAHAAAGSSSPTGAAVRPGALPAARTLAGLGPAVRLVLRRNRVRLAVWWIALVGLLAYVGVYYRDLFGTQQALDEFAAVSDTPGIRALTGLAADPATLGGAVWTKIWMTLAVSLALGVVFLVTRNGRADEEAGRTELLRSRVLGQHASSVATWRSPRWPSGSTPPVPASRDRWCSAARWPASAWSASGSVRWRGRWPAPPAVPTRWPAR